MAEIHLYTPMAGTQLSSSMVQPQNPNYLVGPQFLNTIVVPQLQLSASMADNPTVSYMAQSQLPNDYFFKIVKFSAHLF